MPRLPRLLGHPCRFRVPDPMRLLRIPADGTLVVSAHAIGQLFASIPILVVLTGYAGIVQVAWLRGFERLARRLLPALARDGEMLNGSPAKFTMSTSDYPR